MPSEKEVFRQRAKQFREATGLTHEEVAAEMGVSVHTVRTWEKRTGKVPRAWTLVRLARLYGCRAEDFFNEPDLAPPGITLTASDDVPDDLRKEAVRCVRDLSRKYRARMNVGAALPPKLRSLQER